MFDAGFLEMLVIGVIALLVLGPERLPVVATKIGRFVGKARAFIANTRSDIERELKTEELRGLLDKQEKEIRELRNIMQSNASNMKQEVRKASMNLDKEMRDIAAATQVPTPNAVKKPTSTPLLTPDDQQDKNANS